MNQRLSEALALKDITSLPTSRRIAKTSGAKQYFTGRPCCAGHVAPRRTDSGSCALCCADRAAAKYATGWRQGKENRKEVNDKWNASEKAAASKTKWKEKDPKRAWAVYSTGAAKARAIKRGLPFDLTSNFINSITPTHCPVFGTEFKFIYNKQICSESATLDRLRPDKGYVQDNVAVISMKANTIKNAYNSDDVYAVAVWMRERGL